MNENDERLPLKDREIMKDMILQDSKFIKDYPTTDDFINNLNNSKNDNFKWRWQRIQILNFKNDLKFL